jgi:hypothetical protein
LSAQAADILCTTDDIFGLCVAQFAQLRLANERNGDALVVAIVPYRGGRFFFVFFIRRCLGGFDEIGGGLYITRVKEEELNIAEKILAWLLA